MGRSLFKLASGLSDKIINFNLDEFLQQVDEMRIEDENPGQGAPKEDWFSTHPFSPLRVRALKLFHESCFFEEKGTSVQDLEVGVQRLMGLMEPSYLESRTETAIAMRRCLFSGAIVIADADGEISQEEIEVFEKFFGKGEFSDRLNIEGIKRTLPDRIKKMGELTSMSQKMQVMRDLCVISRASGRRNDSERAALNDIADRLGVSRSFICQSIDHSVEPD